MRSAAAGVCIPTLANGFLTRPQPARFRSTGYAMGSKSGNRIYAPRSRAFLKQWKHSRIDRRISCRQDFPSHISSSATALSDSLRRGSFCSARIVRQTRVESRPSNPEGSRGFESAPLRQPVLVSGDSPLKLLNSPRQRLLLHICGSGENHFPVGDSQIRGQNLRWQMRRDHPSRTGNGVELGVIFFLTVAFNCPRMREIELQEDEFMPQPNDKCPCGSGKAYKDCCGKPK
jgi:hypothetical protein